MARITNVVILSLLLSAPCGTPALAEPSPPVRQAIRAYQSKDYRGAIQALSHAGARDELAHYYRALSYQQISDFREAETEYRCVYENGRDKDLTYKAWQGLQGLEKVRKSHASLESDTEHDKSSLAETPADNGPHPVKLPVWNIQFTPGCGRHRSY
jgi:hypothetical protein